MPIVKIRLNDFQRDPIPSDLAPRMVFTPSGPGFSTGARVLVTKPRVLTYFSTETGYTELELGQTTNVSPDCWYDVRVEWLDAEGSFVYVDYLPWKLRVPEEGGEFGKLIDAQPLPLHIFVVYDGVEPEAAGPGDIWWDVLTDDIYLVTE